MSLTPRDREGESGTHQCEGKETKCGDRCSTLRPCVRGLPRAQGRSWCFSASRNPQLSGIRSNLLSLHGQIVRKLEHRHAGLVTSPEAPKTRAIGPDEKENSAQA